MNATLLSLWPKFQHIMDLHIESVKKYTNAGIKTLVGTKDGGPHYILRRYAEFAGGVLKLNEGYNDGLLNNSYY